MARPARASTRRKSPPARTAAAHPAATVTIDGNGLRLGDVVAVARRHAPVAVAPSAWPSVDASRRVVDDLVARGEVAYGITTGFGEFAQVTISRRQVRQLQRNLVMSHAVGVGPALPADVVRAMMLLRAQALVKGVSGVRRDVIQHLVLFLNNDVVPVVPSRGSVGSSGDLAPLAHVALSLIGLGDVVHGGQRMTSAAAHRRLGVAPLGLEAKEGLALINGTQMMAAIGCLAAADALALLQDAQIVAAMGIEALMGSVRPFDAKVHALRPHAGQGAVAANLRRLTEGSRIVESHVGCSRVQDAYSLRCTPQVLGACRDTMEHVRRVLEIEINSATDNPLVFPDGDIVSQGNFHGEPLAIALDALAIALSEVASLSERRTERLVNPDLSEGLKPFLADRGGLNSGFMIAQYVAAALVSENKVYAHPASVDSIPTSANKEDHNSMGSVAALKLGQVLENARCVVGIEALCAAQALDFKRPLRAGRGSAAAHARIRHAVPRLREDRVLAGDLATMGGLLQGGALRDAVVKVGIDLE